MHISGSPGDKHLEFATIPILQSRGAKRIHLFHQALTFKRTDTRLIRHDRKQSHGAIRRRQRLIGFKGSISGKWFEGRHD